MGEEEVADPCASCGGMCCSFAVGQTCFTSIEKGARYDSTLMDHDPEQLLLADGSVPDMEWYVIRIDPYTVEVDGEDVTEDGDPEEIEEAGVEITYNRALAFVCNHLEDGMCSVYDERPSMCQNYECEVLKGDMTLTEMKQARGHRTDWRDHVIKEVTDRVNEILARVAEGDA